MDTIDAEEELLPLVTLKLDIGVRDFFNIDELRRWLNEEKHFFEWMAKGSQEDSECAAVWNTTSKWIGNIDQFIHSYSENKKNEGKLQEDIKRLKEQIKAFYMNGKMISSKSKIASFGKLVSDSDGPVVACYAVYVLMNIDLPKHKNTALKGAYLAFQFQERGPINFYSSRNSINALNNDWNDRFNALLSDMTSQKNTANKEYEDLLVGYSKVVSGIESQEKRCLEKFDDLIKTSNDKLNDVEEYYDKKLATKSSVDYWSEKSGSHKHTMCWAAAITLLIAGSVAGVFIYSAFAFLDETLEEIKVSNIGIMFVISTIGIWVTRLSAKIFIANLHLYTDSKERVTMIMTYLAMLRDESSPIDNEKQIILNTLFRPSSTGFIKDDGPKSFNDFLTKNVKK